MGATWGRRTAVLAASALVVASCGGNGSNGDPSPAGEPDARPADAAGDIAGADRAADLRVVSSIAPQTYDPVTGAFPCDVDKLSLIYDTLIRENPDGTHAPGLASDWSTPDDQTFELTLRTDVVFQDGTPFDSSAVQAHLERALTDPLSSIQGEVAFVDEIETPDGQTVRLRLSEARAGVLPALLAGRAGMVPSPAAVDAAGDDYGGSGAVGAGPYEYVEHIPGEHLRLDAWDDYYDPDLQLLGGFEHFGISQQFPLDEILAGNVNYAAVNDDVLPDVEAAAEEGLVDFVVDPTTQFMQLFVNFGVEPFDDIRVRQALNHAIDRETVTDVLSGGAGFVAWGPLPTTSWAHNPEVEEMYPYDPERAEELLAEAGHADGLSFEAGVIQIPLYQRGAEVLQDMLADVGIEMTLVPVTGDEVNQKLYVTKELSAAITAFNAPSDPGLALEAKYSSRGAQNPAETTVDEVDELLAEGAAATERDDREAAYQATELLVMEHALEIPIYHFAGVVVFDPGVQNVVRGYTACQGGNYLSPPVFVGSPER